MAGPQPWRTDSIVATADHNTPTDALGRRHPRSDLADSGRDAGREHPQFGAKAYFPFLDKRQGIVHVIGPEQGATLPG